EDALNRNPLPSMSHESTRLLHVSLALLSVDPNQKDYLYSWLGSVTSPDDFPVLRDALAPYSKDLLPRLWRDAEQLASGRPGERFALGQLLLVGRVLAAYDPAGEGWEKLARPISQQLVAENAIFSQEQEFRPVREKLMAPLTNIYRD